MGTFVLRQTPDNARKRETLAQELRCMTNKDKIDIIYYFYLLIAETHFKIIIIITIII